MTAPTSTALTVKAKQVKVGDRIDGRIVKHVVKGSSGSTRNQSNGSPAGSMPNLTFTSNVIEIYFTDCSEPLYRWPDREVQVQR